MFTEINTSIYELVMINPDLGVANLKITKSLHETGFYAPTTVWNLEDKETDKKYFSEDTRKGVVFTYIRERAFDEKVKFKFNELEYKLTKMGDVK